MEKRFLLSGIAIAMVLLLFVGCKNKQDHALDEIEKLEAKVFGPDIPAVAPADLQILMDAYVAYSDNYPEDTLTPEFMFKAAEIATNINQAGFAITIYDRILNNYSGYVKSPDALFMSAFTYENHLGDIEQAKERYEKFLEEYPEHSLAPTAKICLESLGLSPEEMIQRMMEQQQTVSDSLP